MRVPRVAALVVAVLLLTAVPAFAAFDPLPGDGSQVNNDPSAGIDPSKDAGLSDVTGGSLAGGVAVPWATFEQKTSAKQQVFVRAFKAGAWATEGHGTVNGVPGGPTTFPGSLNFDQGQDGEAPAIDFAGTGRTVPWATWYEATTAFGGTQQIFASRFDQAQDKWVFAGQGRGAGVVQPPSLNIDTSEDSAEPVVAGGSTNAAAAPGPWITWEENANNGVNTTSQVFVVKPIKLDAGETTCPVGTKPAGSADPVGGFCWQQTGIERVTSNTKPSLNVDVRRDGVEPDIAFTGPNDTVPWVVWYEEGGPGQFGVSNKRVFAAKGISGSGDGGITWQAVGNGTSGKPAQILAVSGGGNCVADVTAENDCSLNKDPTTDAEDPRVAAGTMTSGSPTVPWVVWDEKVGGVKQIFVSRLVGGDHFELANVGAPLSLGSNDSTRPDITFSGNTPYVSWRETISGSESRIFAGHFVNPANPTFVLDTPGGVKVSAAGAVTDLRAPISSGCTANPTNADGSSCQGGALGTPFFLFTDGLLGAQKLFARAYSPEAVTTSAATGVTQTSATLNGSVNPAGAPVAVHFEFGPTTAYGSSTPVQTLGVGNSATPFSATVNSFAPSSTVHYRAVAQSDFGTFAGADQTFTTAALPPPPTNDEPHSQIKGLSGKVKAKKLKGFHGTASDHDGVARVQIALVGVKGGAHVAAVKKKRGTCLVLQSDGSLKSSKADSKNRCTSRNWLAAKGTASWSFKLKKKLPKGSYVLFSRAIDTKGKVESHFSATRGNRKAFKVT